MHKYSFEKLDAWIEAKEFTKAVYQITNSFPDTEKFGLTSQLRRASVSVCSNIAEGITRTSYKDRAHFMAISYGSAIEVLNQLIISYELGFILDQTYNELRNSLESISNKINGLRNYYLRQLNNNPPPK